MTRRGPRRAVATPVAAFLLWLGLAATTADAHIVYGRPTLLSLVSGAELVAHVRVEEPRARVVLPSGEQRPVVRAVVREAIQGPVEPGQTLTFATHGHGVAEYETGEQAIVFLAPLARSRELDVLAEAGIRWISFQEHDARFPLTPANRERWLEAARRYAAAEKLGSPPARVEALRAVTLDLLTSGDPELAAGALQDVVGAGAVPLVTREDVPLLLEQGVRSDRTPMGVRVGLLAELDRRGWVEGGPHWIALLESVPSDQLAQVARAAGRNPSPEVEARLISMLDAEDPSVAEGAALALGGPAHAGAVPALARALGRQAPRVRMAAIRALGRVGTPEARAALERAATAHEDAATRRRAAAEVRLLTR